MDGVHTRRGAIRLNPPPCLIFSLLTGLHTSTSPPPVPVALQEWYREAELKHARVAMMAVVGFIFTDFYTLPGYEFTTIEAHDAGVANGSMSQLLLWIGLVEVVSAISIDQMLRGSGREPGDFGLDPLGMINDPAKKAVMQEKELANGRLAMFAFGGMVTQSVLTGNTFPYLFG